MSESYGFIMDQEVRGEFRLINTKLDSMCTRLTRIEQWRENGIRQEDKDCNHRNFELMLWRAAIALVGLGMTFLLVIGKLK